MSTYIGIDPGGIQSFGWCVIEVPSNGGISIISVGTCSDSQQAIRAIAQSIPSIPLAAGIDAPMYWARSKERLSDRKIRNMVTKNGGHSATVGHVNSLRGACLVQGILSDVSLHQRWPEIRVTESHPKALLAVWPPISELVEEYEFNTEHERDAFIGAYAAWQYVESNPGWKYWVLGEDEVFFPSGYEVAYWFPNEK